MSTLLGRISIEEEKASAYVGTEKPFNPPSFDEKQCEDAPEKKMFQVVYSLKEGPEGCLHRLDTHYSCSDAAEKCALSLVLNGDRIHEAFVVRVHSAYRAVHEIVAKKVL